MQLLIRNTIQGQPQRAPNIRETLQHIRYMYMMYIVHVYTCMCHKFWLFSGPYYQVHIVLQTYALFSLLPVLTDLLLLQLAQVPRYPDLVIFCVHDNNNDNDNNTTNYFTPCTFAWGKYILTKLVSHCYTYRIYSNSSRGYY